MPAHRAPRSAPFSAICFRSGSAFKGGKGVATYIGLLLGFAFGPRPRLLRHLARGRGGTAIRRSPR